MLHINSRQEKAFLLALWAILNIIQALFTELAHDEAYYWLYSERLSVGYFDHPPMIACMIKLGYSIIQNELGVRLMSIVFSILTLLTLDKLTGGKNFKLLFIVFASVTCCHVYSFIATPDSPLLLFSALFLLCYKNYLKDESWINILSLSMVISLLFYSKYHAILIILFVFLSNPKLALKRSFYLITILSIVFYLPHIFWQIQHDYPSYQYHVQNRNQMPYKPTDTLGYLLGLILIIGPLLIYHVILSFKSFKSSSLFDKSLKYLIVGFSVFFLFTTLNTRAEANWNIPILIPLIYILIQYALNKPLIQKYIYKLGGISLVIFLLIRVHLIVDLLPESVKIKDEFHGGKKWATEIEKVANGKPVVFSNSYQNASKHSFYSNRVAHSHNNPQYRRNQFDLWPMVDSLQGKEILFIANWDSPFFDTINTSKGTLRYKQIESYHSYPKVTINTPEERYSCLPNSTIQLTIEFNSNDGDESLKKTFKDQQLTIISTTFLNQKLFSSQNLGSISLSSLNGSLPVQLKAPNQPGKYYFRINLKQGELPETINSALIRLDVH